MSAIMWLLRRMRDAVRSATWRASLPGSQDAQVTRMAWPVRSPYDALYDQLVIESERVVSEEIARCRT